MRRVIAWGALGTLAVLWACLAPPINLSNNRSDGGPDGSSGSADGNSALIPAPDSSRVKSSIDKRSP